MTPAFSPAKIKEMYAKVLEKSDILALNLRKFEQNGKHIQTRFQ